MSTLQQVYQWRAADQERERDARRPRLLYLITRSLRAGAQVHLLDLALGMRERFEVDVAAGDEGFLTDACRQQGIPVHVLRHLGREIRPFDDLRGWHELRQLMRERKPDLVHAHTFKAGFLGRFAARQLRIPSVYTAHMWPFGRAFPLSWRIVAPICERLAARWCDRVISVSQQGADDAAQLRIGQSWQVVTIWNGIPDHPLRARLNHDRDLVCTMVARFAEPKDHRLLLRAFARVPGEPRLKLVGEGAAEAPARKLAEDLGIRDRVEFLGSRGDVPEILAQTDVFALASNLETLPISILEAMRAGLPVIASNVGGVAEEVVHGETGFVVGPGSVEEFGEALRRLLADQALRIAMGRAGRKRFEELFLAEKMIKGTEGVYRQVLAERFAGR